VIKKNNNRTSITSENNISLKNRSFIKYSPAKTTIVYDTYWKFAAERQAIFFRRLNREKFPWTTDVILSKHKFTNVYRATDRVSQYLIKNVIYGCNNNKEEEIFFRILIFKLFNKIETWKLLTNNIGIPSYKDYSFEEYDRILSSAMIRGVPIFSGAYIMPSGSKSLGYNKKHQNCLKVLETMMKDMVPIQLSKLKRMQDAFDLLRSYQMVGDFLAYQYVTDINYSELTNFSEMEFVVPGPGAMNGLRKCFKSFGGLNEEEIIRLMADNQEKEFERLGLNFRTLWGRRLQLIDCQNLFCEVDKYSRIAHPEISTGSNNRTRIKQLFRPNMEEIDYWFPPKWKINNRIKQKKNDGFMLSNNSLKTDRLL